MTEASTIVVTLAGRDVGLSALLQKIDQQTQKGASSALALQAAQARLEAQQGNLAGAATRLRGALAQVDTTTVQTVNAQRQLLAVETQLATGTSALGGHFKALQGSIAASGAGFKDLQGSLSSIGGAIGGLPGQLLSVGTGIGALTAAVGVGVSVVNSFADAFKFKAELDATTASINAQLAGVRDTSVVYASAAQFANQFKLTQQETTQAIQASIGVMRASKAPVEDILGVLARLQVLSPEQSLQEAALAVKALASGDITSLVGRFEVSRDVANQMKQEIAGGADAVAVLAKFLDTSGIGMDALAARTTGAMGAMKELAQAQEQLTLAQAAFAQGPGLAILNAQIAVTSGATRVLSGDFAAMGASFRAAGDGAAASFAADVAFLDAIGQGKSKIEANVIAQQAYTAAVAGTATARAAATVAEAAAAATTAAAAAGTAAYTAAIQQGGDELLARAAYETAFAAAMLQSANAATISTGAMDAAAAGQTRVATTAVDAATAVNAAALAAQEKSNADQVASVDAQTHALAQQQLATAAQVAAQALLAGGQAGASTAARLAGSSSQIDVLTAAFYRLAAAQAAAKAVDPLKGVTEDRLTRDTTADRAKVKSDQAIESNRKLLASIAAVNKANSAPPKAAGGGGGGGAGSPKLTAQQKLNNSLQADQSSADSKYEDAAKQHLKRLLDIQKDFNSKTLAQQQANEVSKRQSQADFYDRLTSSDLNKKQGGSEALRKIDADYQAAYAKSQELAAAGNAKLAADYLALKQKQAEQELTFQENTAKAAADKDTAEVQRLARIQELRRAAAAEEEKQLLAGGDANVKARDQALADEEAKTAESQDKIGTATERAAQRKVAAAVASGNAVDAELAKVAALGTAYGSLPPPRGTAAGGAGGTLPTPADVAPAPNGDTATGAIVNALNGAQSAIVGALAAVQNATKEGASKIAGAVNSIPRSVT